MSTKIESVPLREYAEDMGVSYQTARNWFFANRVTGFQAFKRAKIMIHKTKENGYAEQSSESVSE